MKTKMIPLILMLLAGAIASVIMYIFQYDTKTMLIILLAVLLLFYLLGVLLKKLLDRFEKQIADAKAKEGEVIEKEVLEVTEKEEESEAEK